MIAASTSIAGPGGLLGRLRLILWPWVIVGFMPLLTLTPVIGIPAGKPSPVGVAVVSMAVVLGLAAIVLGFLVGLDATAVRAALRRSLDRCPGCLHERVAARCPECGQEVGVGDVEAKLEPLASMLTSGPFRIWRFAGFLGLAGIALIVIDAGREVFMGGGDAASWYRVLHRTMLTVQIPISIAVPASIELLVAVRRLQRIPG